MTEPCILHTIKMFVAIIHDFLGFPFLHASLSKPQSKLECIKLAAIFFLEIFKYCVYFLLLLLSSVYISFQILLSFRTCYPSIPFCLCHICRQTILLLHQCDTSNTLSPSPPSQAEHSSLCKTMAWRKWIISYTVSIPVTWFWWRWYWIVLRWRWN